MLKNKLKSPPGITFLSIVLEILFSISDNLVRVSNCFFSMFELYRLTSRNSLSQIFVSSIKILPRSLFLVWTKKSNWDTARISCIMRVKYFPFKIVTPLLFIINRGVYLLQKTKPFDKELFLRYSNTFILLLDC